MPTYQYACTECGHDFEQFQGFSDDALTVCPVCQGRLRKVYNAVGVVFKGSGFYRNDSRTDDKNGKNGKDETATSSGSDSSSGSGTGKESTGDTKSTGTDKTASSSTPASTPASTGSGSSTGSGGAGSTSAA